MSIRDIFQADIYLFSSYYSRHQSAAGIHHKMEYGARFCLWNALFMNVLSIQDRFTILYCFVQLCTQD